MRKRPDLLLLLPFATVLGWLQWQYRGYIKDDTYIALRYARNLAEGHGMVFNHGQRLEGYTDFLWVLLSTPAFWLGVDPVVWVKVLACLFGQLGLVVVWELSRHLAGGRSDAFSLFGAGIWAVSGTVILWSMAGMEPTAMAVLCSGGALCLMKLWDRKDDSGDANRLAWYAGLLIAGAALCRPEGHAIALVAAAVGIADAIRRNHIPRPWLTCAGILTVVLGPYHLWRWLYFGSLVPNTFRAKASAELDLDRGLQFAGELFTFQVNSALFVLALVSLVLGWRKGWFARLLAAFLALFFVAYLVKIGRDEMKWFRLYLPVYPLLIALAADGVRQLGGLAAAVQQRFTAEPTAHHALAVVLALGALAPCAVISVKYDLDKAEWHNQYLEWSERSFQRMAAYVAERSEPGEVVVFQDMGAAPFAAGDLRWVDTIGILDLHVAQELEATGVNPFLRNAKRKEPGGSQALGDMDRRLRDYFLAQDPGWVAFIAYVPKSKRRQLWRSYKSVRGDLEQEEELFAGYIKGNGHSHYLARDGRFQRNFHYVKAWDRLNHGYWVVLYRASDQAGRGGDR